MWNLRYILSEGVRKNTAVKVSSSLDFAVSVGARFSFRKTDGTLILLDG